ncbi:hypothetical protein [Chryseobacterium lacus]|uniref:hypothetical protein n=1 Tax=Chryseobacterium lacus TaxID=2058346 RepID=UPI000F85C25F|nr:hypothetical protein [Chryseobacterium lacus]RST28059.1 hypothetical protein EIZ46_02260 [Chryseobacterium lacus]RST28060.1 hypothetical protein EIZ46_02275 [Chryseobacterium lacus]
MNFNKIYFLCFFLTLFSCSAQKNKTKKINTKVNKEYIASRKTFVGKLNPEEFKQIRDLINKELKTEVPNNKSILINYYQLGTNCLEYGLNVKDANTVIENCIRISSRISKEQNAIDFFVYSENALRKERIENRKNFILDSGFFAKNIFTLQENCRAFFILKPNGDFMKYYGSDYYSEVENFLSND